MALRADGRIEPMRGPAGHPLLTADSPAPAAGRAVPSPPGNPCGLSVSAHRDQAAGTSGCGNSRRSTSDRVITPTTAPAAVTTAR